MKKGEGNILKPNSSKEDLISGMIQRIFTTDEALYDLCRSKYLNNTSEDENYALAALRDYVHPSTGETVMTRMVKLFNKRCDQYTKKFSNYKKWIKEKEYLYCHDRDMFQVANVFVNLKKFNNFSAKKKDSNGDSPKSLLKDNVIWNKSRDTEHHLKNFNRAQTAFGRFRQTFLNAKVLGFWATCIAIGYGGCKAHKTITSNRDNTLNARRNLIEATADSTHRRADAVIALYVGAVEDGYSLYKDKSEKINAFKDLCVENGISVKPVLALNDTVVSFDGKNLKINAEMLVYNPRTDIFVENETEIVTGKINEAVNRIKQNPKAPFVLRAE